MTDGQATGAPGTVRCATNDASTAEEDTPEAEMPSPQPVEYPVTERHADQASRKHRHRGLHVLIDSASPRRPHRECAKDDYEYVGSHGPPTFILFEAVTHAFNTRP